MHLQTNPGKLLLYSLEGSPMADGCWHRCTKSTACSFGRVSDVMGSLLFSVMLHSLYIRRATSNGKKKAPLDGLVVLPLPTKIEDLHHSHPRFFSPCSIHFFYRYSPGRESNPRHKYKVKLSKMKRSWSPNPMESR